MWDSLAAGAGGQGMDFRGNLELAGSGGVTIEVPPSDLLVMMAAALDAQVGQEFRQPRPDTYARARSALGFPAGVVHTGFTYAVVIGIGVQMTRTSGSITFDIGNSHSWAVTIASLCQSVIPSASGSLLRI